MPILDLANQQMFYLDQGTGPVLVLFPDAPHGVRGYADDIAHLAKRFRVIAVDCPGAGGSTRNVKYQDERQYDLSGYAADMVCHVLLELGFSACTIVGIGTGALAALHMAGHQAKLHHIEVHGLICDSFLADLSPRDIHRAMDRREHYYVRHAELLASEHGPDWRQVVDLDTDYWRTLADRGGYAVPDQVLNAVACPVLLTGNQRDLLTPAIAQEYARLAGIIPAASIHLVSQSGHRYDEQHPLMWANPEALRHAVDGFLDSVASTY